MPAQFNLLAKRREAWNLGIEHREKLLGILMPHRSPNAPPLLKDVVDDLLEYAQGVRLRSEVLPLDVFAQSEVIGSRIEVSVNNRIPEMRGVIDASGVATVAKWHESVHVERDLRPKGMSETQLPMSGMEDATQRLIVCRRAGASQAPNVDEREFFAENAGLAAAIAFRDLDRSSAFREFSAVAKQGGDITVPGWTLLAQSAAEIGVNRTALSTYLVQRGQLHIEQMAGRRHLIALAPLTNWEITDGPNLDS